MSRASCTRFTSAVLAQMPAVPRAKAHLRQIQRLLRQSWQLLSQQELSLSENRRMSPDSLIVSVLGATKVSVRSELVGP